MNSLKIIIICIIFVSTILMPIPIFAAQSKTKSSNPTVSPSIPVNVDKKETKEKIDPERIYKLIAVYIVDKKPKAIIESIADINDSPSGEYQVGDYLDEMKTVSISKILLSPTSRVELISNDGSTYLLKPYALDDGKGGSSASAARRGVPSILNSGPKFNFKQNQKSFPTKNKNDDESDDEDISIEDEQQSVLDKTEGNAPAPSQQNIPPTTQDDSESAVQQKQPPEPKQQAELPSNNKKSPDDLLGRDRPSNPFEN